MHPVNSIRRQYFGLWIVGMVLYTISLMYIHDQKLLTSIVESVLYGLVYSAVGYSYWFVVRYNQPNKKDYFRLIITHSVSVFILMFFIIGGISLLLNLIFTILEPEYISFYNSTRSWRIIIGLSIFIVIILFYYLSMYYSQMETAKSREMKLEGLVTEAELEALKSQINPHFIFNSLNSINTLIHISPDKASEMLVKLSQFLRFSLSKDSKDKNKLTDELENIQRYLDIEKVRFGDKLVLEYDISEDCKQCTIPSLLLQPLLENSIKFGVYENMNESVVKIKTVKNENLLNITITNNFEEGVTYKKGSGIGLKNVDDRLRLLYRQAGLMKTKKQGLQFIVELNIPQL